MMAEISDEEALAAALRICAKQKAEFEERRKAVRELEPSR